MNDALTVTRLLTRKNDLASTHIQTDEQTLAPEEIAMRIDRLALTTNNITYAAFGDAMRYWDFFPAPTSGFGHMPVWGFGDVVASSVPGIAVGERFYGYFPIASHLRLRPHRISARGFYDGAEHRQGLTSAYNHYVRCSHDPAYRPEFENHQILLRPLFITSFMLADFLQDNNYFGARQVVFSSASSKTAYGTAFCLQGQAGIEMIALTSPSNRDFVDQLGCYQQVLPYGELASIRTDRPTLYVDFSGDESLRSTLHHHLGEALVYDCFAGSAQNTQFLRDTDLPGPAPRFYFAPDQIRKRNADWGHETVNRKFNEAQLRFIERVGQAHAPWLQIQEHSGFAAAGELIAALHGGRIDPLKGHVVTL